MTITGNHWFWNEKRLAELQEVLLTAKTWEEVRIGMKAKGHDATIWNLQTNAYKNKMLKPNIKQGGWRPR